MNAERRRKWKHAVPDVLFSRSVSTILLIAISGCAAPKPAITIGPDAELNQANNAARLAFNRGQVDDAALLYARALSRARLMDDAPAIAASAYNLAACQTTAGRYDEAERYLLEAGLEAARTPGEVRTTDVLLLRAKVSRARGDAEGAAWLIDRALNDGSPTNADRLEAQLLKGWLALQAGNTLAAAEALAATRQLQAKLPASASTQASISGLAGELAMKSGDAAQAATEFDRQTVLLREAGQYRDIAKSLARASAAYTAAKQPAPAADRAYRAARAMLSRGDKSRAIELATEAEKLADEAGDVRLAALAGSLKMEASPTTAPTTSPAE